jgi:ribosomal protein L37AE/L43A
MGLLDSLKSVAGSVGESVSKGARTGTDNLKKMTEKSKIKREIAMLEADINNSYIEIGKKFFETISRAPSEEYAFDVENIISKTQQLDDAKKSLMDLEDKHSCPSCGATVTKEQKFCDKCGYKLEGFAKVEVVEEVKINDGIEVTPVEPAEEVVIEKVEEKDDF